MKTNSNRRSSQTDHDHFLISPKTNTFSYKPYAWNPLYVERFIDIKKSRIEGYSIWSYLEKMDFIFVKLEIYTGKKKKQTNKNRHPRLHFPSNSITLLLYSEFPGFHYYFFLAFPFTIYFIRYNNLVFTHIFDNFLLTEVGVKEKEMSKSCFFFNRRFNFLSMSLFPPTPTPPIS